MGTDPKTGVMGTDPKTGVMGTDPKTGNTGHRPNNRGKRREAGEPEHPRWESENPKTDEESANHRRREAGVVLQYAQSACACGSSEHEAAIETPARFERESPTQF